MVDGDQPVSVSIIAPDTKRVNRKRRGRLAGGLVGPATARIVIARLSGTSN